MPGILLNRLSRAKQGEAPEDVLEKARVILLEEMLPVLHPEAVLGADYIYLEDILSREHAHREGEILGKALEVMRKGQCDWLAVTEVSRLSGSMGAADEILTLCREHRIPIYTRERLRHPYQPWRAESAQELIISFFVSTLEVMGYRGRLERARDAAYPVDPATGESRLRKFEGIGRHLSGATPLGYRWDKQTKTVHKADRIPEDVPAPDHIPAGHDTPVALTWWEIIKRARQLGRSYGSPAASAMLAAETGVTLTPSGLIRIWRNPFYAGRPTSVHYKVGRLRRKREQPVATKGMYEPMETWEDHLQLQEAIREREHGKQKSSTGWASGILRCECGEPFVVSHVDKYACRNYLYRTFANWQDNRAARTGVEVEKYIVKPKPGWIPTPTCGSVNRLKAETYITACLKEFFARPYLIRALKKRRREAAEMAPDRQSLVQDLEAVESALNEQRRRRANILDLAESGILTKAELELRLHRLDKEQATTLARKKQIDQKLSQPAVSSASVDALERYLTVDFDKIWNMATPAEKAQIARAAIDYVPVFRIPGHRQSFGAAVFRF